MAELFNIDHDAGNLNEYDSSVTDGGDLSAEVAAALAGSYGLQCVIDDTTAIYGEVTQSAPGSDQIRYRFYFDPNSFSGDGSDQLTCCQVSVSGSPYYIVRSHLYWNGSDHFVRTLTLDDESTQHLLGDWQEITDEPHYLEILLQKESSDGADDGVATWWLGGVQQGTNASLGNWTLFAAMSNFRLGALNVYANVAGTVYLDELVANDDGGEIGPVAGGTAYFQGAAGVLTPTGTIIKGGRKVLAGASTFSGIIIKKTSKSFTGSSTLVGSLIKQAQKSFTGATTSSGSLVRQTQKALTGSVTGSGTLVRSITKSFTGSVTTVGSLVKQTAKSFTGSVTASGVLGTVKAALLSIGGSITPSGSLVKQTRKILLGSVTATGSLVRQIAKAVIGSVTAVGSLITEKSGAGGQAYYQVVDGVVTMTGSITRHINKNVGGVFTAVGSLARQIYLLFIPARRIYAIASENRVYAIEAESRIYSIASEDRIYPIPG